MKLLDVLAILFVELGVGTALFVLAQRVGEIRPSFFSFMAWLTAISFFIVSLIASGPAFYMSVYFPSVIFAILATRNFSGGRPHFGKGLLIVAAFLGAFFLSGQILASKPRAGSYILAFFNIGAGTLVFGWSNGSMILGHWYLIMQGLSFGHFQRATQQLLLFLGIRTLGVALACLWLFSQGIHPFLDPLFASMRILWGLILPGILGFMAWRCSLTGSNQAGTGLLYIAEVAVLIGEILAIYLGF